MYVIVILYYNVYRCMNYDKSELNTCATEIVNSVYRPTTIW